MYGRCSMPSMQCCRRLLGRRSEPVPCPVFRRVSCWSPALLGRVHSWSAAASALPIPTEGYYLLKHVFGVSLAVPRASPSGCTRRGRHSPLSPLPSSVAAGRRTGPARGRVSQSLCAGLVQRGRLGRLSRSGREEGSSSPLAASDPLCATSQGAIQRLVIRSVCWVVWLCRDGVFAEWGKVEVEN